MPLMTIKTFMKKSKEKCVKMMKVVSLKKSTDKFGCLVVNLAGRRLFHIECPNGSDEMVGYLDYWVRLTWIPGLTAYSEVVLVYGDQILSHMARFRDYGILDGSILNVVIQPRFIMCGDPHCARPIGDELFYSDGGPVGRVENMLKYRHSQTLSRCLHASALSMYLHAQRLSMFLSMNELWHDELVVTRALPRDGMVVCGHSDGWEVEISRCLHRSPERVC